MKMPLRRLSRMIAIGTVLSATILFALGALFLYRYLYTTITETEHILVLRREYGVDPLHTTLFQALQDAQKKRHTKQAPDWAAAPQPFAQRSR